MNSVAGWRQKIRLRVGVVRRPTLILTLLKLKINGLSVEVSSSFLITLRLEMHKLKDNVELLLLLRLSHIIHNR